MSTISELKKRAQSKNIPFDLDENWLSKKLNLKKCEVSDIPFNHDKGAWCTQSIDRINSDHGYTKHNCKVILLGLNTGKGQNCTYDEIYNIAKAFVKEHERKNI